MVEHDDGFRRLDELSPVDSEGRGRRSVERLDTRRDELAPRGVGAILDAGFDALRARFAACFGACALLWIGPAWLMAYAPPEDLALQFAGTDELTSSLVVLGVTFANSLLTGAVQIFATILVSVIVRAEFIGRSIPLVDAAGLVMRRFFPLLLCTILVGMLSVAGMLACILPYFFLLWRLSLAPLVCVVEDYGPAESIRRSFELTKGSFLRWGAIAIVGALLLMPLSGVAAGAANVEVRDSALENLALSPEAYASILWPMSTLFFALATAASAAITTAYYYDCRVRREGLDLADRLESIAGTRTAESTG